MIEQNSSNGDLLRKFIIQSDYLTLTNFGNKLKPPVTRETVRKWTTKKGSKPSGPNGYQHRMQIQTITQDAVLAKAWDV